MSQSTDLAKPGHPWADYLDARLRLVHYWQEQGIPGGPRHPSPGEIADQLNHLDGNQVHGLLHTSAEPPNPGTTRAALIRLDCAFQLMAVSKRYEMGHIGILKMTEEVADIIKRMP